MATRKRTQPRLDTCYHEAGHAVVMLVQGLTVNEVSVVSEADYDGSCVHPSLMMYNVDTARERRVIARDCIVACYAGMAAERMYDPSAPDWHGRADEEDAMEVSREYGVLPRGCTMVGDEVHTAYLDRLRAEAQRLVRRHWDSIEYMAKVLAERHTLTAEEAERVLAESGRIEKKSKLRS